MILFSDSYLIERTERGPKAGRVAFGDNCTGITRTLETLVRHFASADPLLIVRNPSFAIRCKLVLEMVLDRNLSVL